MQGQTVAAALPPLDVICLSHLRWDFVYQRPQHLMSRAARQHRVFFVEEPKSTAKDSFLRIQQVLPRLWLVTPFIPRDLPPVDQPACLAAQLDKLLVAFDIRRYVLWYYTPMALRFTSHLVPTVTVYDCMDELSLFRYAPQELKALEGELLRRASVVFTGGQSLYEAKHNRHPHVHLFASSIDVAHFAAGRRNLLDPPDQAPIPHPRLGFFGVLDERMDMRLVAGVAAARPQWHLVMIGPLAKISAADLPRGRNIHYLGRKQYGHLPLYLAGWDAALLPFARSDATRFISPTKTPEYLAGGKPVVSTGIRDVAEPYGQEGLVAIGDTVPGFIAAVENALGGQEGRASWLERVDRFLGITSWDATWAGMWQLAEQAAGDHV